MKPTIGRIVHFIAPGHELVGIEPATRAAIVVDVYAGDVDQTVALFVMGPAGNTTVHDVPFSERPAPGCWSWPPREGA